MAGLCLRCPDGVTPVPEGFSSMGSANPDLFYKSSEADMNFKDTAEYCMGLGARLPENLLLKSQHDSVHLPQSKMLQDTCTLG